MRKDENKNSNLHKAKTEKNDVELLSDVDIGRIWGISKSVVAALCESDNISNCVKIGDMWLIPSTTKRPEEKIISSIVEDLSCEISQDDEILIKEYKQRAMTFNGMTAKEWAGSSRSVWNDVSSIRKRKHLEHGATFPLKLCSRLIKMYSKENDTVLDPFLGTGTTVLAALKNKRKGIGIELTDRFFDVAWAEVNKKYTTDDSKDSNEEELNNYRLIKGDCSVKIKSLSKDSIQLTITSPPYADLIHKVVEDRKLRHKKSAFVYDNNATTNVYSDDERDLGNMPLEDYIPAVEKIMEDLYRVTKPGGYNIWVVKDFRDTRRGIPYIDLHTKIALAGEKAGFKYHDLIIWDQNEQRRLVLLGYPSVFYVNQNHSYMVVLRK